MNPRRNLWPLGIILTFAIFITGTICLLVFACRQKSDLVSSDYYEQEIRFQQHLDQIDRASKLAGPPSVSYDLAADCIRIRLPLETSARKVTGRIHLYRPSAAGLDRQVPLTLDPDGLQLLDASGMRPGLWKVRIFWAVEARDYFVDQSIVIGPAVNLKKRA